MSQSENLTQTPETLAAYIFTLKFFIFFSSLLLPLGGLRQGDFCSLLAFAMKLI